MKTWSNGIASRPEDHAAKVQLSQSVMDGARGQELRALGVDGVFSFESSDDLFFPSVAAAPVCDLDPMTNVAIAFPRSPWHLANAAYDLQELSGGRFRLGLGKQVKAHVEKRFGREFGRPVAHMREWVLAIKAILADLTAALEAASATTGSAQR